MGAQAREVPGVARPLQGDNQLIHTLRKRLRGLQLKTQHDTGSRDGPTFPGAKAYMHLGFSDKGPEIVYIITRNSVFKA